MSPEKSTMVPKTIARVLLVTLILGGGFGLMRLLISMREAPRQLDPGEPRKVVQVVTPTPEDVQVVIAGYGEVRALDVVRMSAEVVGQVVTVHERLEVGEVIPEGELLFRIDQRDYTAAVEQANAQVSQMTDSLARLRRQYAIDQERLETLARSRDLSQQEFDRLRRLYEEDEVGTQSNVDKAEMGLNQSEDAYDQMAQAVELYPLRIREAEAGLESAKAQLYLARTRLERTEVRAPFTGRLEEVQVEEGQYVSPGASVLTLANDALLEIRVPLDSRDAQRWLVFTNERPTGSAAWFGAPEPVTCTVRWSEDPHEHEWQGTLDRVVSFDENTRTVTVAVRLEGEQALSTDGEGLPLVDGMFCNVAIPGKMMEKVYRLPRWAVTFEEQVYVAEEGVEMLAIEAPRGSDKREQIARAVARVREEAASATQEEEGYVQAAERGLSLEKRVLWHGFEKLAKEHVEMAEASGGRPVAVQWVPRPQLASELASHAFSTDSDGETGVIETDTGFYIMRPQRRLEVRDVEVVRTQGEETLVGSGLKPGDMVIVTRLLDPLPGALLDVQPAEEMEDLS